MRTPHQHGVMTVGVLCVPGSCYMLGPVRVSLIGGLVAASVAVVVIVDVAVFRTHTGRAGPLALLVLRSHQVADVCAPTMDTGCTDEDLEPDGVNVSSAAGCCAHCKTLKLCKVSINTRQGKSSAI